VHAVDGSVAPATDGRFIDEPSSFYGWLTRQHKTGYKAVHSSAAERGAGGNAAGCLTGQADYSPS